MNLSTLATITIGLLAIIAKLYSKEIRQLISKLLRKIKHIILSIDQPIQVSFSLRITTLYVVFMEVLIISLNVCLQFLAGLTILQDIFASTTSSTNTIKAFGLSAMGIIISKLFYHLKK